MARRRLLAAILSALVLGLVVGAHAVAPEERRSAAPPSAAESLRGLHFSPPVDAADHGTPVASDAVCVEDRAQKQTVLVYAWPSDVGDRSARWAPGLRRAAMSASAQLNDSARRHGGAAARMRLRCTGGSIDVVSIRLPSPSAQTSPASIHEEAAAQLAPLGLTADNVRRVLFVDAGRFSSYAWTVYLATAEGAAKPPASNPFDGGEPFAVLMNRNNKGANWPTLLHEWLHTMGAVGWYGAAGAGPPNAGFGHCYDGTDIMCYEDGSLRDGRRYTSTRCEVMIVDCGGDDYFAPRPAAGSWPATHRNVATDAPGWLDYEPAGAAPTSRPALTAKAYSSQAVRLSWTAVPGATSYRLWCSSLEAGTHGLAWLPRRRVTATTVIQEGFEYGSIPHCRVHGEGPGGAPGPSSAATPRLRLPEVRPPRRTRITGRTRSTISVAWDRALGLHVKRYEVWTEVRNQRPVKRGSTTGTRFTIRNLRPGRSYSVRVVTFDRAGNWGYGPLIAARTR